MFGNRIDSTLPCAQMLRMPLWVGIWSEKFSLAIFSAGHKKLSGSSIGNDLASIAQNGGRFGAPARRVRARFFR